MNDISDETISVISAECADEKEMWTEAITELVLRMYEIQKDEEKRIKDDPLSMISMNAEVIDTSLFDIIKKPGGSGLERKTSKSSTSSASSSSSLSSSSSKKIRLSSSLEGENSCRICHTYIAYFE